MILRRQGFQVLTANSGADALQILEQDGVHLVLTDQMMPEMSGTELTRLVKAARPHMPVILISGMNELPPDAGCADRFLSKVDGPELLFQTIAEVLEAYRYADTG